MPLASLDDVKRVLRSTPPSGYPRIKIGTTSADDMTPTDATKFLDAQEAYIISRINFTPATIDVLMKEVHAHLTAFQIYIHLLNLTVGGDIPEFVKVWMDWAEGILTGIVKGTITVAREGLDAPPILLRSSSFRPMRWEKIRLGLETDWVSLSQERIIPYSDKVKTEKVGGTAYTRDTDYEISYKTGEIRRIGTGLIPENADLYIDYFYIHKGDFYESVDSIDYGKTIKLRGL